MAKKPEAKKSAASPPKAPQAEAPQTAGAVAEQLSGGKSLILSGDALDAKDLAHIKHGQNRGSENVSSEDLVIPRLEIVQAMSPHLKEGDPKYNPQARAGMLFNTVTGQLYGKETFIVPVFFQKMWNVWMARKDKDDKPLPGGFFGSYQSPEEAADRQKKEGGEEKYIEVIDTPQHLCLLVDAGGSGTVSEVMLSMPRTKAKVSRNFNSMIRLAGGDRFSRVYRITTQLQKNPKGDFYNYAISPCGHPVKALYDRAEKLYAVVSSGQRRVVAHEDPAEGPGGDDNDANAEM